MVMFFYQIVANDSLHAIWESILPSQIPERLNR